MMSADVIAAARLGIAAWGLTIASAAFALQGATPPPGAGGTAAPVAAKPATGQELFANWGCGACHSLADAGGTGHVGPSFDGNPNLTEAFVSDRVTNGQGAMPAFGGQMSDEEIATISKYIVTAAKK